MQDRQLAATIVEYLNDLLKRDRPAVAALIANRVPCRASLADHPQCQVSKQHGGFHVGMLGLLNGLCGVDELGNGLIVAVFNDPDDEGDNVGGLLELKEFKVSESLVPSTDADSLISRARSITLENGDLIQHRRDNEWFAYPCFDESPNVSGGDAIRDDDGKLKSFPSLHAAIAACVECHEQTTGESNEQR